MITRQRRGSSVLAPLSLLWAVVFAVVGLGFLLAPQRVAAAIEAVGQLAHLRGSLADGVRLWWVLALSLMAVLTVLALGLARQPENRTALRALLTGKLVSTLGFAALAIQDGSIWWICAVADGFVAITLCAADRAPAREESR